MTSPAELSSLVTAIEELQQRITAAAEELSGTADDDVAIDLYEVERALRSARRKLHRASEELAAG